MDELEIHDDDFEVTQIFSQPDFVTLGQAMADLPSQPSQASASWVDQSEELAAEDTLCPFDMEGFEYYCHTRGALHTQAKASRLQSVR